MLFELALLEPDNQCDTFQGTRRIFTQHVMQSKLHTSQNKIGRLYEIYFLSPKF